jgi:hypothetical protein
MEIGIGVSSQNDPGIAGKEAVANAMKSLSPGVKIDLAIVFSSVDLAGATLLKTIAEHIKDAPIIGSSGAAVISNQGILKHGVAIMLLHFASGVHLATADVQEIKNISFHSAGERLGEKLLSSYGNNRRDLSIILSDGLLEDNPSLIYGLQEKLGMSFPVFAGCASDNLNFLRTFVYHNRSALNASAAGVLLGGTKLRFSMSVKHGWKPLGKPRQVTLSKGNLVFEIGEQPAIQLYEEYLSKNISDLKKELKHFSKFYPLGIYLEGENEYLLRNIVSIGNNGSLQFQGDVPQGSQVRLMIGTRGTCLAAAKEAAEETAAGMFNPYLNKKSTNFFVLLFDSVSRYTLLDRDAVKELGIVKKSFGQEIPIIGLYTYGEYAPLKAINYRGKAYAHNQAIAMLAIGE